jgi:hypothetical protein
LESLVDQYGKLSLGAGEDLYVDFGERDDQFNPGQERKVNSVIWIPDIDGFDIALLEIEKHEIKNAALAQWGRADGNKQEIAVVGYPDFHHPVDPCSDAAYSPYKTEGDAKFVSLGCAFPPSEVEKCKNPEEKAELEKSDPVLFDILFHTATTTMGESGGILVARDLKYPTIIGVHVCCSYPEDPKYYKRPPSKLKCANLKRTEQYNQAISVCSLFTRLSATNPKIKKRLMDLGLDLDKAKKNCGVTAAAANTGK